MSNWNTPKINWQTGDVPLKADVNRWEENAQWLKENLANAGGIANAAIKAAKLADGTIQNYYCYNPVDGKLLDIWYNGAATLNYNSCGFAHINNKSYSFAESRSFDVDVSNPGGYIYIYFKFNQSSGSLEIIGSKNPVVSDATYVYLLISILDRDGNYYSHIATRFFNGNRWMKVSGGTVYRKNEEYYSVFNENLADYSVTNSKLGTSSVSSDKIATSGVTATNLATGAVTDVKLATSAVTETKLATNAVTAAKIATNAVTTVKIANGNITEEKLSAGLLDKINKAYQLYLNSIGG